MSRKASIQSPNVAPIIARIKKYLKRNNMSELRLAKLAAADQSSLHRFLTGERKTVTKAAGKCVEFIDRHDNQCKWHNNYVKIANGNQKDNDYIKNLVEALKEGDSGAVEAAVSILDALKPVLDVATAVLSGMRKGGNYDNN